MGTCHESADKSCEQVSFWELQRVASEHNSTLLGYRKKSGQLIINPPNKHARYVLRTLSDCPRYCVHDIDTHYLFQKDTTTTRRSDCFTCRKVTSNCRTRNLRRCCISSEDSRKGPRCNLSTHNPSYFQMESRSHNVIQTRQIQSYITMNNPQLS